MANTYRAARKLDRYPPEVDLARRIQYRFRNATAAQKAEGYAWYPHANALAKRLAEKYRLSIEQVAGALAALSPQVSWEDQERFIGNFLAHVVEGTLFYPHPGFLKNRLKAATIIRFPEAGPLNTLGGSKVRAFYLNILSPTTCTVPCIDRHAASLALGHTIQSIPRALYSRIQDAYSRVSRWENIPIPEIQATTWVVERQRKGHTS